MNQSYITNFCSRTAETVAWLEYDGGGERVGCYTDHMEMQRDGTGRDMQSKAKQSKAQQSTAEQSKACSKTKRCCQSSCRATDQLGVDPVRYYAVCASQFLPCWRNMKYGQEEE